MEHLFVALWRAPDADLGAMVDAWLPHADADENVRSYAVSVALADQGRYAEGDPVDCTIALGVERAHGLDDVPARSVLYGGARTVLVWRTDPRHQIVAAEPTPLKVVSFVRRAPHLTHEQFVRHWTEVHAPLARRHHPALADYTQHLVRRAFTPGGDDVDGIAELCFRSHEEFEHNFYDSDEGKAIIAADVERFLAGRSGRAALMRDVAVRRPQ